MLRHAVRLVAVAAAAVLMTACQDKPNSETAEPMAAPSAEAQPAPAPEQPAAPAALNFTMDDIHGTPTDLAEYRGKVVLIVNTASKCGNTPQYENLEAIYKKYHDRGLVILGFPANNFGRQEPDTNDQIAEFCKLNYGVTFPMFSKVSVKGDDQCALYQYLTSEQSGHPGDVRWNFEKFLLDRHGNVVARFNPRVKPDSDEVIAAIETQLAMN